MHPNTPQVVGAAFVSGMSSGVSSEGSKPFLPPVSPQPGVGDPNVLLSGSRAVHGYFLVLGISEAPASLGAPFLLPLVGDRVLWIVGAVLPPSHTPSATPLAPPCGPSRGLNPQGGVSVG